MADGISFQTDEGRVGLVWSKEGVTRLQFMAQGPPERDEAKSAPLWVLEAVRKVMAHLHGDPQELGAIPVDLSALTPFQRQVAEVLRRTRPGDRLTYGDVARLAGRPGAARAVGRAIARNPLLLLVPCHRVWSADGEGGWSAFGSLDRLRRIRALDRHTGAE
jgi:methylated-DNA-[protein]-cysteine S-methyltransferase